MERALREITSVANPRVRRARTLRTPRGRRRCRMTIVDGVREIRRALAGRLRPVDLFVSVDRDADRDSFRGGQLEKARELEQLLDDPRLRPVAVRVPRAVMDKVGYGARDEGAVAVFEIPDRPLAALRLPDPPLVLVADRVEKPGNLGAVFRSADASGCHAVVGCDLGTDLFNPNVIRASLGTVFTMPAAAASRREVVDWLRRTGLRLWAARVDAQRPYWDCDFRRPTALLVGSEAEGLDRDWAEGAPQGLTIPMAGHADSLNVSVSAALLLFEAARQRRR